MYGSMNVKQERYLNKHAYACTITGKALDTRFKAC